MIKSMKSKLLITIATCVSIQSATAQSTTVNGNLKGLKAENIQFAYADGSTRKTDTVKVVDGKFVWKTTIVEPTQVYLFLPNRAYPFFADKGKISITGIGDSVDSYKVTGSKMQDEANAYEASIKDLSDQESPLYQKYGHVSEEEQAALETKLKDIRNQKNERAAKYIAAHPGSYYSIYLVSARASYGMDYSDVKKLYDQLDAKAIATASGKKLTERMDILKRSAIGSEVIDFTQADTSGVAVHFSAFKGKYVLIDFWASWCGPCRAENPNVLKAYDKYKDKNFTVVGVSLDDKAANWKKAVIADKMPWTQVSDLKGWQNELSTYYGIQGIPSNLLIDPSGKIIAKDVRGAMLHKKLDEVLN